MKTITLLFFAVAVLIAPSALTLKQKKVNAPSEQPPQVVYSQDAEFTGVVQVTEQPTNSYHWTSSGSNETMTATRQNRLN